MPDEPTPRELLGQIAALREVMDERGKRYYSQFASSSENVTTAFTAQKEAIATALAAAKEAVATAQSAQEKFVTSAFASQKELFNTVIKAAETAVEKAENAQQLHNVITNEFRKSLEDANKLNMPRFEAEQRFQQLRELIDSLRSSRDQDSGQTSGVHGFRVETVAIAGVVVAVLSVVVGVVLFLLRR